MLENDYVQKNGDNEDAVVAAHLVRSYTPYMMSLTVVIVDIWPVDHRADSCG